MLPTKKIRPSDERYQAACLQNVCSSEVGIRLCCVESTSRGFKNKLERVQRMSAHFICLKYQTRHFETLMLKVYKLALLELTWQQQRFKILFQILHAGVAISKDNHLTCYIKRFPITTRMQCIHRTNTCYSKFPSSLMLLKCEMNYQMMWCKKYFE